LVLYKTLQVHQRTGVVLLQQICVNKSTVTVQFKHKHYFPEIQYIKGYIIHSKGFIVFKTN